MTEYYDEAGVPIRARFNYGFIEPGHTPKVIQVDSEGRPLIKAFDLDIALSRAALAANVAQHMAQGNYGYSYTFADDGTPIPEHTSNTLLEVSGFGKITFVSANTQHGWCSPKVTLDGVEVVGISIKQLGPRMGTDNEVGRQMGWIEIIRWETGKYAVDFYVGKLGSFGTSAKVEMNNPEASAYKAHIRANYFVSASKEFSIEDPAETDPAKVRQDLAEQLGIDPEGICAIYQVNWDEEKKLNIPSMSAVVHQKLSLAGEGKVAQFLDQRRAK